MENFEIIYLMQQIDVALIDALESLVLGDNSKTMRIISELKKAIMPNAPDAVSLAEQLRKATSAISGNDRS